MGCKPLAVTVNKLCLLFFLGSLIWTGCAAGIVGDLPDRCPVTLNTYGHWRGGNVTTQWSPDAESILFSFASLNHPSRWYIASPETGIITPLEAYIRHLQVDNQPQWARWLPTDNAVIFGDGEATYSLNLLTDEVARLVEVESGLWSPDGQQIVFLKGQNWREWRWHIMSADGTGERLLTDRSDILIEGWHPSEPKILLILSGDRENHPDNIGILDVNGGHITQLTDTEYCEFQPRWSPDGRQIAFTAWDRNRDIYVMDADGDNVVNLTNTTPQHEIDFSWSPDGRQIVYTRYHATGIRAFSQEIYVMNTDGSEQRPLTDTPDEHEFGPVWSPDGKQIAFWSTAQVGEGPGSHQWTLNVMNADGSNRRVLATFGPTTLESDDSYPSP